MCRCGQGAMRAHATIREILAVFLRRAMFVPGMGLDEFGGQFARRVICCRVLDGAMGGLGDCHLGRGCVHAFPIAVEFPAQPVHRLKVPPGSYARGTLWQ